MGVNNKKKSKGRQVLSNPMVNPMNKLDQKQMESLKTLLKSKLLNLYPNAQVSSGEVISSLSESEKSELFKLPRKERSSKLKEFKKQKRDQLFQNNPLLPDKFKTGIVLGLKKCLSQLEKKSLKVLIYDSDVNIEAMKCLFDKGDLSIIPLAGISSIVRTTLGFPALCLGFPKDISDPEVVEHFKPILDLCSSFAGPVKKPTETKSETPTVLPDVVPKMKKKSKKTYELVLLHRKSDTERIFDPTAAKEATDESAMSTDEQNDFTGDFISFDCKPSKKRKRNDENSVKYKRTNMEIFE